MRGCGSIVRVSSRRDLFFLTMMVVGLELVLCGVKQEPSRGGINPSIGIANSVGHLTGTVVMHDSNNNGQDASTVQ